MIVEDDYWEGEERRYVEVDSRRYRVPIFLLGQRQILWRQPGLMTSVVLMLSNSSALPGYRLVVEKVKVTIDVVPSP